LQPNRSEVVIVSSIGKAPEPGLFARVKTFVKKEEGELGDAASALMIKTLDVRVPTTTPHMSEVQRSEIMAKIKPGDICLETNDAYPGWQTLEFATTQSEHTHAFTYEGDGKMLQSTTPDGVQRTDLNEYLQGRLHVKVIRPNYASPDDLKENLKYQADQLGKGYNNAFDTNNTKQFYCFQLGSEGLAHMDHPIDVPLADFHGHEVYSAKALENLPGSTTIVDDHTSFWKNQLSHWPVAAGMLGIGGGAAVATGLALGAAAAVVAAPVALAAGLLLSICVGNKMQTGQFGLGGNASEEA
jgi:YD repeat-containing protein